MADEELVKKIQDGTWKNPELRDADLSFANLRGAKLQNAIMIGVNLKEASLYESELQNSDLQGADLKGANLHGANLQKVNFQWANLQEVDLQRANLREAKLQNAKLRGADLHAAKIDKYTKIDLPEEFYVSHGGHVIYRRGYGVANRINTPRKKSTEEIAPELRASPEDRISVRPDKIPTGKTKTVKTDSLENLILLRKNLDSLHGRDEKLDGIPNTEPVPLTKDELTILIRAVDAAISLHKVPEVPSNLRGALSELMLFLKASAERLQKLYDEEAEALGNSKLLKFAGLIGALTLAWQTLQAFITSLGGSH